MKVRKNISRLLFNLVGLIIVYFLLLMALPRGYPFSIIPAVLVGAIAGVISHSWKKTIIYSVTPILLSIFYLTPVFTNPYTFNKILSTGIVFVLPYLYHTLLSISFSLLIYSFRNMYIGGKDANK